MASFTTEEGARKKPNTPTKEARTHKQVWRLTLAAFNSNTERHAIHTPIHSVPHRMAGVDMETTAETGAPGLSPSTGPDATAAAAEGGNGASPPAASCATAAPTEAATTKHVREDGEEEDEEEDEEALFSDIFGGASAANQAKKAGPCHADQRRANQKELDFLLQGKPCLSKPKPKPVPAAPAATAAAAGAEDPTTTQDGGRSSLGSSSSPSSAAKAKAKKGGGAAKGGGEEEEGKGEEESEPDEFDSGYVPQPVRDLRLLQWFQEKAALWCPCRELTTQEASLVNTGGDFEPLREGALRCVSACVL